MRQRALGLVVLAAVGVGAGPARAAASDPLFAPVASLVDPGSGEAITTTAASAGTVFAGAPGTSLTVNDQGAIFAFDEPAAGWSGTPTPSATLVASDPQPGDDLGTVVVTDGSSVVSANSRPSGAGEVRIFNQPSGGWTGTVEQDATLAALNGVQLYAPTVSGSTIVALGTAIGSNGVAGQQLAYVFTEPAGGWNGTILPTAVLVPPGGASVSDSGSSIAIGSGEIVAGSVTASAAYVFSEPSDGWSGVISPSAALTAPDAPGLGWSVALVGSTVVAGQTTISPDTGYGTSTSADAFGEPAGGWSSEQPTAVIQDAGNLLFTDASSFGAAAMVSSGSTLLIPATAPPASQFSARSYAVYDLPAGGWSGADIEPNATLTGAGSQELRTAAFDGDDVIAGYGTSTSPPGQPGIEPVGGGAFSDLDTTGTSAAPGTAAALSDVQVFTDVSAAAGITAPAAALTAPTASLTPADKGETSLAIFGEPSSGWSSVGAPSAEAEPAGAAGDDTVLGVSVDGSTVATTWGDEDDLPAATDVYTEPTGGWAASIAPAAALTDSDGWPLTHVQVSGDTAVAVANEPPTEINPAGALTQHDVDVFQAPADGWSGTIMPAIRIQFAPADVQDVAVQGDTVAVSVIEPDTDTEAYYVFTAAHGNWAVGAGSSARLATHNQALGPSIAFSGPDLVVGAEASGGNLVAASGNARVFAPRRGGWFGNPLAVATLRVPTAASWIFREPAGGWRGTLAPSARLLGGSVTWISADARQIAVSDSEGSDEGCEEQDWVLSRPAAGWVGALTGEAPGETPLSEGGPCGGPGGAVSVGGFAGSDAVVSSAEVNGPGVVTLDDVTQAPPAATVATGTPQVTYARLGGTGSGRPSLNLDVTPGRHETGLTRITVTAPAGLSFVRSLATPRDDIPLCDQTGITCSTPRADQVRVTINPALASRPLYQVVVPADLIRETTALRAALRVRSRTLRFSVAIVDQTGASTVRTVALIAHATPSAASAPAR